MDFHSRRVDLFLGAEQPGNDREKIDGTAPNSNNVYFRGHKDLKKISLVVYITRSSQFRHYRQLSPSAPSLVREPAGRAIQFEEFPVELFGVDVFLHIHKRPLAAEASGPPDHVRVSPYVVP